MISQEKLKERLHYNPETGAWVWVDHPWFKSYAGRPVAGSPDKDGYPRVYIGNKAVKLHRLAFLFMLGEMPPDEVDHVNGDKSDNRWCNLRLATRSENGKNLPIIKTNTSGVSGVHWSKSEQKWQVRIMANGKRYSGGYFADLTVAKAKRDAMVRDLHEQFGRIH